jgi:hypothetical protein
MDWGNIKKLVSLSLGGKIKKQHEKTNNIFFMPDNQQLTGSEQTLFIVFDW